MSAAFAITLHAPDVPLAVNDNAPLKYNGVLYQEPPSTIISLHPLAHGAALRARLSSANAGTNSSGNVQWRQSYSPFGSELGNTTGTNDRAGFTGHIKDSATGLNYMQARYYDPVIGRFLSVDPVTFLDTGEPNFFNRYAYTFNDPINLLDSTGQAPSRANSHTPPIVLNQNAQRADQNAASRPRLSLPVRLNSNGKAVVTSKFGPRNIAVKGASKNHSGTDFRAPKGADILATQDGNIENIGQQSKAGDVVIVRNSDGSRSGHGHTGAAPGLKVGDSVQAGQVIGESNGSGTGAPHQHYTYTPANSTTKVDPMTTQLAPLANQTCNKGDSGCP